MARILTRMFSTSMMIRFLHVLLSVSAWLAFVRSELPQQERLRAPVPEFSRVDVFKPRVYHARSKRQLSNTRAYQEGVEHFEEITIALDIDGKQQLLDLALNRDLIPKGYFEKHQEGGNQVVRRPGEKEVELCHYQGRLRNVADSWAGVSTCNGLCGLVFDGKELHYIERATHSSFIHNTSHYLYTHSNFLTNTSCGNRENNHNNMSNTSKTYFTNRRKRSASVVRVPYNANATSRYVELVLVADRSEYLALGKNKNSVISRLQDMANIVNTLYNPLNIFVALVGVEIWTEHDETFVSSRSGETLKNFLRYRYEKMIKDKPNDNAQLLTRTKFEGSVVGKANTGAMCSLEYSGGVITDYHHLSGIVATTVAHEMGHNFGMFHDDDVDQTDPQKCYSSDKTGIMVSSSSSLKAREGWSFCSMKYLAEWTMKGEDICLYNKPAKLIGPICGNGFVEEGEQCDCGHVDHCNNVCCNATTCTLFSNASCATGKCCDLKTCQLKTVGTSCREASQECDLPEYCKGDSEFCPGDVFKMDGILCGQGQGHCYGGSCGTHTGHCQHLWGPTSQSHDDCYKMNLRGVKPGYCQTYKHQGTQKYIKCHEHDIKCGLLHCTSVKEQATFQMDIEISKHWTQGSSVICHTLTMSVLSGSDLMAYGMVPNGAKCGDGKMCLNQTCVPVERVTSRTKCPDDCSNRGICNNQGHCHCDYGYGPPDCDSPGHGGSMESGPMSDPDAYRSFVIMLYLVFLGIIPLVSGILLTIHLAKINTSTWFNKSFITSKYISCYQHKAQCTTQPCEVQPEPIYSTIIEEKPPRKILRNNQTDIHSTKDIFDKKSYCQGSTYIEIDVRELLLAQNLEPPFKSTPLSVPGNSRDEGVSCTDSPCRSSTIKTNRSVEPKTNLWNQRIADKSMTCLEYNNQKKEHQPLPMKDGEHKQKPVLKPKRLQTNLEKQGALPTASLHSQRTCPGSARRK